MKKYILQISALAMIAISLSSCLKDKKYDDNVIQSLRYSGDNQKVVSIALTTDVNSNVTTTALNATTALETYNLIPVTISGGVPAKTDVHIVVDTIASIVDAYNVANTASAVPLRSNFTIVSKNITIPAGQSTGYMVVKFKPIDLLGNLYGLGVKIVSVDNGYTIASNGKNQGLALLVIKNKYDGVYEITGSLVDANGVYIGDYGDPAGARVYSLATTGSTTVLFFDESYAYPNYIVINGTTGAPTNTGIRPLFTFDAVTDAVVGMTNSVNAQAGVVGAGSKFNDADHSIDLQWTLGRWKVTEHYKYLGPR